MPLTPIPMRRFADELWARGEDSDEFWEHGVGAFRWVTFDGHRACLILVPSSAGGADAGDGRGFVPVVVYPMRQADNWAAPGDVNGWDGNEDRPTFTPSIDVPGHWHGFIVNGVIDP